MVYRKIFTLFIAIIFMIQLPYIKVLAVESATGPVQGSPPDEYPPWLLDLRDRFSFVASGLKLLKDVINLDAAVGNNPWTLRSDTMAAINFLPVKVQLGFAQFFTGNLGRIITEDHSVSVDDRREQPQQLFANSNLSADFALTEQMSKDLLKSAIIDQLRKALTDEQLIDFGVFILSKAPFFPKESDPHAWEKWNKIKQQLVYYDIYLLLIVVAVTLMVDKAQLQVSGYLFKLDNDSFRIGWYGGVKNFGVHLQKPEFKAGLRTRSQNLETSFGIIKRMSPAEQTAVEARVVPRIFSSFINPNGWQSEASLSSTHIFSDQTNPTSEGQTNINFNATLKTDKLRENNSLSIAIQNSIGLSTNGQPNASATAILTDEQYGFDLSASMNLARENHENQTKTNLRMGLIGSYQWEGGATGLKYSIISDTDAIRSLLSDISKTSELEQNEYSRVNLAIYRQSLKLRLTSYIQKVKQMMSMLPPSQRYFPLSDREIGIAVIESQKEISDKDTLERTQKIMDRLYFHN